MTDRVDHGVSDGDPEAARVPSVLRKSPLSREDLGKILRQVWVDYWRNSPDAKPGWLVPWNQMSEDDQEVDCQMAVTIWNVAMKSAQTQIDAGWANIEAHIAEERTKMINAAAAIAEQVAKDASRTSDHQKRAAGKLEAANYIKLRILALGNADARTRRAQIDVTPGGKMTATYAPKE